MEKRRKISKFIADYWPSLGVALAIVIISLVPVPEVKPLEDVPLIDKWVHFLMYGGLCLVCWWNYYSKGNSIKEYGRWILWIVAAPICLGGALELAQAYLTNCRSGDWLDFLANSIGVILAIPIGIILSGRPRKT